MQTGPDLGLQRCSECVPATTVWIDTAVSCLAGCHCHPSTLYSTASHCLLVLCRLVYALSIVYQTQRRKENIGDSKIIDGGGVIKAGYVGGWVVTVLIFREDVGVESGE
ncbi:hypothetical protein J6590_042979 [Homalodisca vitripennis]|nr:hypothetical protein J6590_042979 [Homalodisca vitripennis]